MRHSLLPFPCLTQVRTDLQYGNPAKATRSRQTRTVVCLSMPMEAACRLINDQLPLSHLLKILLLMIRYQGDRPRVGGDMQTQSSNLATQSPDKKLQIKSTCNRPTCRFADLLPNITVRSGNVCSIYVYVKIDISVQSWQVSIWSSSLGPCHPKDPTEDFLAARLAGQQRQCTSHGLLEASFLAKPRAVLLVLGSQGCFRDTRQL